MCRDAPRAAAADAAGVQVNLVAAPPGRAPWAWCSRRAARQPAPAAGAGADAAATGDAGARHGRRDPTARAAGAAARAAVHADAARPTAPPPEAVHARSRSPAADPRAARRGRGDRAHPGDRVPLRWVPREHRAPARAALQAARRQRALRGRRQLPDPSRRLGVGHPRACARRACTRSTSRRRARSRRPGRPARSARCRVAFRDDALPVTFSFDSALIR